MTDKEKFLAIDTYEEFDKRRGEFKSLKLSDKEIRDHIAKIFPKPYGGNDELYKTPLEPGKKRIIGR